jgi:hypothetical protein
MLRIVEIGQAISEPRSTMKQRPRWPSDESSIAVRRPGCDPLEKSKYTTNARHPVERGNEMHLAGARIGKTGIDPAGDKCPNEAFGAVYGFLRRHRWIPGMFWSGNTCDQRGFSLKFHIWVGQSEGHAATASITVMGGRNGLLLTSRKFACLKSARYLVNVRSWPVSITIMLRSLKGANPFASSVQNLCPWHPKRWSWYISQFFPMIFAEGTQKSFS